MRQASLILFGAVLSVLPTVTQAGEANGDAGEYRRAIDSLLTSKSGVVEVAMEGMLLAAIQKRTGVTDPVYMKARVIRPSQMAGCKHVGVSLVSHQLMKTPKGEMVPFISPEVSFELCADGIRLSGIASK